MRMPLNPYDLFNREKSFFPPIPIVYNMHTCTWNTRVFLSWIFLSHYNFSLYITHINTTIASMRSQKLTNKSTENVCLSFPVMLFYWCLAVARNAIIFNKLTSNMTYIYLQAEAMAQYKYSCARNIHVHAGSDKRDWLKERSSVIGVVLKFLRE